MPKYASISRLDRLDNEQMILRRKVRALEYIIEAVEDSIKLKRQTREL